MSKKLKVYTCFRRGFILEAKLKILTKQYDEVGTVDTIEVDTIGKIFEKNKDIKSQYNIMDEFFKYAQTL